MDGHWKKLAVAVAVAALPLACADWDNPTALSELEAEARFEVEAARVETLEEVEIHVTVLEGGAPMSMRQAELEIEHEGAGTLRVVGMEPEEDGYAARVVFYEPGEHHLHFMGRPVGHTIMHEMGDHEVEVFRRHEEIGPYWLELELDPAPVFAGDEAHIHLYAFQLLPDGTPGDPVAGLEFDLEIHDPAGVESVLGVVEEEEGDYEAEFTFEEAGTYELHVEMEIAGGEESAEFHIPVITTLGETDDNDGGDGHGHDH